MKFYNSVIVDEKSRIVLSKEIREICGFKPGDKLALFIHNGDVLICDSAKLSRSTNT